MNTITKEQIDEVFAKAEEHPNPHQMDAMEGIYKLMIPEWDNVKRVNGWPHVGEALATYCIGKFREFDKKHHPEVKPAGIWINNGPGMERKLGDWEFSMDGVELEMME